MREDVEGNTNSGVYSNSMQDEWTKAWNDVQRMRDAARSDEERDMALKWILWMPQ